MSVIDFTQKLQEKQKKADDKDFWELYMNTGYVNPDYSIEEHHDVFNALREIGDI